MISKNEKQIINIIKYAPPIFIISLSIIITLLLYIENHNALLKQKSKIKEEFIKSNKLHVKRQVEELNVFIAKTQRSTENKLKKSIKGRVYEAHAIATKIYEKIKR